MKILITAVALAITFIAVPVITQSALAESPNDVIVGGKNIGQDPDFECSAPTAPRPRK